MFASYLKKPITSDEKVILLHEVASATFACEEIHCNVEYLKQINVAQALNLSHSHFSDILLKETTLSINIR